SSAACAINDGAANKTANRAMLRLRFMRVFTSPATGLNLLGPNFSRRRRRKSVKADAASEMPQRVGPVGLPAAAFAGTGYGMHCRAKLPDTRPMSRRHFLWAKKTARTWPSAPRFGTAAETTGGDSLSKQSGRKARSYRAAPSRPPGTRVLSYRPFPGGDKTGLLRCDT